MKVIKTFIAICNIIAATIFASYTSVKIQKSNKGQKTIYLCNVLVTLAWIWIQVCSIWSPWLTNEPGHPIAVPLYLFTSMSLCHHTPASFMHPFSAYNIFGSLATKPLESLGVLGDRGSFFRLVTYLLPIVGRWIIVWNIEWKKIHCSTVFIHIYSSDDLVKLLMVSIFFIRSSWQALFAIPIATVVCLKEYIFWNSP